MSIFDVDKETQKLVHLHVRDIKVSDYFGEVSLVHDSVRTASVKTKNYCTLGKISL